MSSFSFSRRFYSFIGRQPILVDSNVKINILPITNDTSKTYRRTDYTSLVQMEGPLGHVSIPIIRGLQIRCNSKKVSGSISTENSIATEQELVVSMNTDKPIFEYAPNKYQEKFIKSMWGTTQKLLANFVLGITEGHKVIIRLVGVGYKARVENESIILKVGFSHFTQIPIPIGIAAESLSPIKLRLQGIDKQQLNLFAAKIRSVRKPEPYKGKGIFVNDETIKLKTVNKK